MDVPGHKGRGEQTKNENGRKLGRSKKTKWRNTKKNQERQGKLSKEKMQGIGRAQLKRKNKRITSTDKRNNWKTKNKYRYAKK